MNTTDLEARLETAQTVEEILSVVAQLTSPRELDFNTLHRELMQSEMHAMRRFADEHPRGIALIERQNVSTLPALTRAVARAMGFKEQSS